MKLFSCMCCYLCTATIFVILVISVMGSILYCIPDWFLGKDFYKMVNQSLRHIHTRKNLFRSGRHPIPEKGPPFVLENQTRYIGEDAMFSCGAGFNGSIYQFHAILWLNNNKQVVNGSNRYITWEVSKNKENQVNFTTNLTILSATEDDFGMYQCFVITTEPVKPRNDTKRKPKSNRQTPSCCRCCCGNSPANREPELSKEDIAFLYYMMHKHHWMGEFHLLQEKTRTRTLFIVPGTLISLAVYFRHLGGVTNFSVRFTRSGQDIQSFDYECSYSAHINALLLRFTGTSVAYNNVTYDNRTTGDDWKARVGVIWGCISPSMYGVYKITILRTVHNKHDGTDTIEKIDYPVKVYIKPKESTIITNNISNNKNRGVVVYNESCWSHEELSTESCKYIKSLVVSSFDQFILYEHGIKKNLVNLVYVAILISVILEVLIFPFCWYKLLQLYYVAGKKCLAGIQVNPNVQYDLFISSVSDDRSFIEQHILPILSPLNLKVFDAQKDIPLGSVEITEVANAINSSRKVLVIASKKYMISSFQNDFEMRCILKTYSGCDLMVIKVDNCLIHGIFDEMFSVINCSNNRLSVQSKTTLMQWACNDRATILARKLNPFLIIHLVIFLFQIAICYYAYITEKKVKFGLSNDLCAFPFHIRINLRFIIFLYRFV